MGFSLHCSFSLVMSSELNQQISEIEGETQKNTTRREELNNAQDSTNSELSSKIRERERVQQDIDQKVGFVASVF